MRDDVIGRNRRRGGGTRRGAATDAANTRRHGAHQQRRTTDSDSADTDAPGGAGRGERCSEIVHGATTRAPVETACAPALLAMSAGSGSGGGSPPEAALATAAADGPASPSGLQKKTSLRRGNSFRLSFRQRTASAEPTAKSDTAKPRRTSGIASEPVSAAASASGSASDLQPAADPMSPPLQPRGPSKDEVAVNDWVHKTLSEIHERPAAAAAAARSNATGVFKRSGSGMYVAGSDVPHTAFGGGFAAAADGTVRLDGRHLVALSTRRGRLQDVVMKLVRARTTSDGLVVKGRTPRPPGLARQSPCAGPRLTCLRARRWKQRGHDRLQLG